MRIKRLVLALAIVAGSKAATAQVNQSLDIHIAQSPNIVRVGAADQLVYELHLTNFSSAPLRLDELAIRLGDEGAPLKTYNADALAATFALVGPVAAEARTIPAGRRAVLYINAPFADGQRRGTR